MVDAEEVETWICGECGTAYEEEEEAIECCAPSPKLETRFQCGVCEQSYERESEAQSCCSGEEDDSEEKENEEETI